MVTSVACWWCCHLFDWESLHFPYKFKANTFYTTGHFCSWECMKAYAIHNNKFEQCEYITLMKKRMTGRITTTKRAPSRYCLKMFGGTMSIEEYRKANCNIRIKIPGEIYQTHDVTFNESKTQISSGGESTTQNLRLKRNKPLERSKGKLETSLGIIRKCNPCAADSSGKGSKCQSKEKD